MFPFKCVAVFNKYLLSTLLELSGEESQYQFHLHPSFQMKFLPILLPPLAPILCSLYWCCFPKTPSGKRIHFACFHKLSSLVDFGTHTSIFIGLTTTRSLLSFKGLGQTTSAIQTNSSTHVRIEIILVKMNDHTRVEKPYDGIEMYQSFELYHNDAWYYIIGFSFGMSFKLAIKVSLKSAIYLLFY